MKLHQLLQAYEFDELMPVINEMFPGTAKYRVPLKVAYDIMVGMRPVSSSKSIRYSSSKAREKNSIWGPKMPISMALGKLFSAKKSLARKELISVM